ncbi:MAG: MFS transporter [Chloroflexi bacterium]|nr:MAG: MFS transporter [Chloroflexota bacterium]
MILDRPQRELLLPLGAAVALSLTGDSTLYAVLPNQAEVVGVSLGAVGVLLGVNRLVRIPANPLAGVLNDRMGRRRLFLLGLVLGILSTLAYGLVRGFWPMLAARLLWGSAWSLINVGGYTMILDRSTRVDRGRMTGFYQMFYLLGLTISPLVGGALTDALGFQPAVAVCAGLSAVGLAVAVTALPETGPERPAAGPKPAGPQLTLRQILALRQSDRRVLLAAGLYFVIFFVSGGVLMSTIGLYLGQRWAGGLSVGGLSVGVASLAGGLLALRSLLGIAAGPVAGTLSDRLRSRWPVVGLGLLLGLLGFALLSAGGGVLSVAGGVALVALGSGALIATLAAVVGDLAAGSQQGMIMGVLATAGDAGSAAGPFLAYALAVALDLRWVYLLCAGTLALGLVAAAVWGRERHC